MCHLGLELGFAFAPMLGLQAKKFQVGIALALAVATLKHHQQMGHGMRFPFHEQKCQDFSAPRSIHY